MGVDVVFLPVECDYEDVCYGHTLLPLERRYDLQAEILKLELKQFNRKISCYLGRNSQGESSYGDIDKDCYGEALMYLTAGELLLVDAATIEHRNKAVWAYLRELPPQTKIVIYWS